MKPGTPHFVAALVGACLLLTHGRVSAQKAPSAELQRILADWQKRQESMASVRYVVKGQRVYPRGSDSDTITNRPLVPESPPRDKAVPNNFTFGLDIAGGRYRLDQTTRERFHAGKREAWYTRATVCAFDGKATQQATPHQPDMPPELARGLQNPDARIITGNVRAGVLAYDYWPLLFGH